MSSEFRIKREKKKLPAWKIRLTLTSRQQERPFQLETERLINNLTVIDNVN